MDSSLINLIPNLVSRRSAGSQRSGSVNAPPSYNAGQRDTSTGLNAALRLDLCLSPNATDPSQKRPTMWSHDTTIAVGSDTTYREFLALLRRKIDDINFFSDIGRCHAAVVAESRGRAVWQFNRQDLDVTLENWDQVMQGLAETRYRGFKVVCWDEDDMKMDKP
jgi:hypothetical protein